MTAVHSEIELKGSSLSKGVAIAPLFFFTPNSAPIVKCSTIKKGQVHAECDRFQLALSQCRCEIEKIRHNLVNDQIQQGVVAILDSHLQIMLDPGLIEMTVKEICSLKPAEIAFQSVIDYYIERFKKLKDPFFRERAHDIQDIARRVVANLCKMKFDQWQNIKEPSILVADELSSTLVAEFSPHVIVGILTAKGSDTSHAAILARAKGIPYISGIKLKDLKDACKGQVIMDARSGKVVLNPTLTSLTNFLLAKEKIEKEEDSLRSSRHLKAETYDGYEIQLSANIDVENELDHLHQYGGHGVGLFRSEYVFLKHQIFPSEEEQYQIYKNVVQKMKGMPLVIRTFDVGGDKSTLLPLLSEDNPYLGCRAIRYLLKEKSIFKTQLKAILRAADGSDVSLMFPMVAGLSELREAKVLLKEAELELEVAGHAYKKNIRLGSMIEVPSAAILSDLIAKECDFLSIGTNDLVQYSLAVDRGEEFLSGFYTPTHPGIIRLIKTVVTEANRQGIPVYICGEIAADPLFTPLLLGLGVHGLSVSKQHIPYIKREVRLHSIIRAAKLSEEALNLGESDEIAALLEAEYKRTHPSL